MALPTGGAMRIFGLPLRVPSVATLPIVSLAITVMGAAAAAEPLRVVASLPPIALVAEELLAERGEVVRLGDGGEGHEHGGRLRPTDARALADADLVLWIGPDLEPTLPRALPGGDAAVALGAVEGIAPRTDATGASDPHVWLSPDNAVAIARATATALGASDPEGAREYEARADALAARIAEAGAAARERLGAADGAYAVEHDAFGHFADWVGLSAAVAVRGQGARSLREAVAEATERDVACVIAEPGEPSRLAAVLNGVPTVTIDPLGRDASDLPDLLGRVAAGFEACLSAGG